MAVHCGVGFGKVGKYSILRLKIILYRQYLLYLHTDFTNKNMAKVIHVCLFEGRRNYYFGSISAIYDVLTEEEVGMTKSSLLHADLPHRRNIMTRKAIIHQGELIRKRVSASEKSA